MKDLTKGSIEKHLATLSIPIAIGMVTQVAHPLIDLYFISRLGVAVTAGVNIAANVIFIVAAIVQILSAGCAAIIAQAVGRKDREDANMVFNQAMALSIACSSMMVAIALLLVRQYLRLITADEAALNAAVEFVHWVLPGYALMLPLAVMTSSLRGIGVVGPAVLLSILTVSAKAAVAPVLIAGLGTSVPMGAAGAGLATTLAVAIGVVAAGRCFNLFQRYIFIDWRLMFPQLRQWRRILRIGLPAGADFILYGVYVSVAYFAIRGFGSAAQAGLGIGSQVLQAVLLPVSSVASAVLPVAGQNLGARDAGRVRQTFARAVTLGLGVAILSAIVVHWCPRMLLRVFSLDVVAIEIAAIFLMTISWSFLSQSVVSTCTSMFQALGNTVPPLISTLVRLVVFSCAVLWASNRSAFRLEDVWHLWAVSLALQALISVCFLRREFLKPLRSGLARSVP